MRYITKSLIFIIFAGLFFTSCEKDKSLMPEKQIKEDVVTSGYSDKKAVINGEEFFFHLH